MKKYILTLCMALLSVCFTVVHAQREELPQDDDEYIEDGYPGDDLDEDPIKVGELPKAKTKCNRTSCEGHENISFSFNNTPHALRMEALVNSIERKGLSDWLFIQESIIKKELDGRNRHVSSTYEFARNEYFANFERDIANRNIPVLSSGRNRIINDAKHKRTPFYKNIKLLKARLQEIKQGNINRSLYAANTHNNRPMSYYKTEGSITSVLNSELQKFYSNEVKINEDLLIRDQLGEMLKSIRAVNQLGVTDNILQVLKNKQIGYYNDFNRWHQISLMQRYLSGLKKGNNSGNIWPKEFGANDYLLAYAKAHRKKDINIFHKEYWKVILKRDYRNNPLKSRDAINKYLRLLDAEITRLLNNVSINVNTSVDFLVSELIITNSDQLKWLNENPKIAIEMQNFLNLVRIDPNPNVFNSTKSRFKDRIADGGLVEKMIRDLKLDTYRTTIYKDEKAAKSLLDFVRNNTPIRSPISNTILDFIKESLENGSVKYIKENYNLSVKSPYNIDMSEVLDSINLPSTSSVNKEAAKKFLCIYKKVAKNDNYKKLFTDIFGANKNINITIEIAELEARRGRLAPNAIAELLSFKLNSNRRIEKAEFRIKFNKEIFSARYPDRILSAFFIAKTIIHESIHAFIKIKQKDCKAGMTLDDLNNLEFEKLIDTYYDGTCELGQSGHQFMFNHMVPVMTKILSEIKDDFITTEEQNGLLQEVIFTPNDLHDFNWNDFYYFSSLQGLQNSDAFKSQIGNNTEREALYNAYRPLGRFLNSNCN